MSRPFARTTLALLASALMALVAPRATAQRATVADTVRVLEDVTLIDGPLARRHASTSRS